MIIMVINIMTNIQFKMHALFTLIVDLDKKEGIM